MKKPAVMILVVFLLFSCDLSTIPNPIIGTYVLRESGTSSFYSATFSFDSDGTFIYSEVVEEEMEVVMEGTYTYSLSFFDFERANGNIGITLFYPDEILQSGMQNLIIHHGSTSFLFDWEADKNTGPKSITLVTNPGDRTQNYELSYYGKPGKIHSGAESDEEEGV